MTSMWFSPDKIFSYNAYLNFVVGHRGCGKTYGCKKWAIKHFLKTGKKFIYLRRYKDELKGDEIATFFDSLRSDEELSNHNLWVKGRRFYCDDKEVGQILFLSVQQSKKSVEYPDYDTIIFDEFIIEKGFQRYLPDEVTKLLNFIDTVFRNRNNCRCICLANAISWVNPYFIFYKFKPINQGYQITQEGEVLLNVYNNELFNAAKQETKLAKLVKGTTYEEMAIKNKFADVNDDFIKKKPKESNLILNIAWRDKMYGLWYDYKNYEYVISYKCNPDTRTVAYTTKDFKPNMMLISDTSNNTNKELKRAFANNYLYFEDVFIRNEIFDLFTLMGVR